MSINSPSSENSIIEAIRNKRELSDVLVTANNNDIISMLNKNNIKYQYKDINKNEKFNSKCTL